MTEPTIAHPVSNNHKAQVDNLYAHYADTICDGDIEA